MVVRCECMPDACSLASGVRDLYALSAEADFPIAPACAHRSGLSRTALPRFRS
jgi:hypothetical protein